MLKIELHAHTDLDPSDSIPYSTRALIERAAQLDYGALAITLHDRYFDPAADAAFARSHGITLLPGIERTIRGKHVLLVNFSRAAEAIETFDDLERLRAAERRGLVVAPHSMFPHPSAMGLRLLDRYAALVDAVEVSAMYTRHIDFNQAAVRWARRWQKPLVGTSDLHVLSHLGWTYTLVDAAPDPDAICAAIKAGRVEIRTRPLSLVRAGLVFGEMVVRGAMGRLRMRAAGGKRSAC